MIPFTPRAASRATYDTADELQFLRSLDRRRLEAYADIVLGEKRRWDKTVDSELVRGFLRQLLSGGVQ